MTFKSSKIPLGASRRCSGGLRTIYVDMGARGQIFLITVFGKGEKANLSSEDKKAIKAFVKGL